MAGAAGIGDEAWYGYVAKPLSRRATTAWPAAPGSRCWWTTTSPRPRCPPTPPLRRLARGSGEAAGLDTTGGVEALAVAGDLQYHVLAFRRQEVQASLRRHRSAASSSVTSGLGSASRSTST